MIKPTLLCACGVLLAAWLPLATQGQEPQLIDPATLSLDQNLQRLKDQSLDIVQQAQGLEQAFLYPDYNRVSVYVGVSVPGLLVKEMTASIDNGAPVTYQYRESESVTLQDRGLHLLMRINAAPGRHLIHGQYVARYSDARPGDPPFTGSYDGSFDKTVKPADVELELQRHGYLASPELRFHDWKADSYSPGDEQDPHLRGAEYLAGNGRYLSAIAALDQMQASATKTPLTPDYYHELANDLVSFGMPRPTEAIYRDQVNNSRDPLSQARARLRLIDFYYQRGYYQQAATELSQLHGDLPKGLLGAWQDLQSRVLLAQGRYGEAAEVLGDVDSNDMTWYMRYNLGVALVNDGRVGQGVSMLDRVGRLVPTDSDSLALRDKANLTLGYHFLKAQQGGTAVPIFGRVRTQGPYSNKALLGLGWAYLAPRGTQQKKTEIGDEGESDKDEFTAFATIGVLLRPGFIDSDSIYRRAGLAPFHLSGKAADEEAQLKQALVPWVELAQRDPIDPAVQEGLLAIPYVLDRLGAHLQAQQYYERAIAAFEQTRFLLGRAEEHVKSGRMVLTMVDNYDPSSELGWRWKLKSLPNAEETFYLQTMLAENGFQEELKNFRDARLLQQDLQFWKDRLGELQQSYQTRTTQNNLPPPPLPRPDAPADAQAQDGGPLQLQMASRLNAYQGPGTVAPGSAPVALHLAPAPTADRFVGAFERMQALRERIDQVLPQLAEMEKAEGAKLQEVALASLEQKRALNQKYLADTRFALARVYDSELRGPAEDSK